MNKYLPVIVLVVLLGLYGFHALLSGGSLPAPDGPDMIKAFEPARSQLGVDPAEDAAQFATLCYAIHDTLESDWEQPAPYIKSGEDVDNLRVAARNIRTKGRSYSERYPQLSKVVEQHFVASVGTSGAPLTPEAKAKWLVAWKSLGESSAYAARKL